MAWADAEKLDDVACRAADQGRRVVGVPCYVSERANLELIVEQAMSEFGRVTSSSTTPAGRCPDRSWTRAGRRPGERSISTLRPRSPSASSPCRTGNEAHPTRFPAPSERHADTR